MKKPKIERFVAEQEKKSRIKPEDVDLSNVPKIKKPDKKKTARKKAEEKKKGIQLSYGWKGGAPNYIEGSCR